MPNYLRTLLVSAALSIGIAGQALAHDDEHDDEHDRLGWEHSQDHWGLENRHDDVHDELSDEHRGAHYDNPNMSRRDDWLLHRQIDREHAWQDNQLNRQHNELHRDLDDEHGDYHGYYDPNGSRYYAPTHGPYFYFGR
ncbi:MAG: hypothetical protein HYX63_12435 [Gammaproteobacteria bacterium]|nr:hypothetical protein [Gammaproteobacteria bacterium]